MPEVVGAAELEVVEVGALDCGLVHATDAVSGQQSWSRRPHGAVTRDGEDQHVGVGAGWKLAPDRLDHQVAEWDLAHVTVEFATSVKAERGPSARIIPSG